MIADSDIRRILFVCFGNICRSPMAELMFKRMLDEAGLNNTHVSSAGIQALPGNHSPSEAVKVMAEIGLDLRGHRARPVRPGMDREYDLILLMDKTNLRGFLTLFPMAKGKCHLLGAFSCKEKDQDIADPFGRSIVQYRRCRRLITDSLLALINTLHRDTNHMSACLNVNP